MNTIPTVGPDTAVAPRTGSGSPQTPSQQRADAAPTVIADSGAASADPGVLLKLTPPVDPRQGNSSVMAEAGGLPSTEALAKALIQIATPAIEGSTEQADLAVAKRINDAFASLPIDVQEAIKQASSPAIAHLLRLAALTLPGIRDAPAQLPGTQRPLAASAQEAVSVLHQTLQSAAPFQLAQMLREALATPINGQADYARSLLSQLRTLTSPTPQGIPAKEILTNTVLPNTYTDPNGLGSLLDQLLDASRNEPSASFERLLPGGSLPSDASRPRASLQGPLSGAPDDIGPQQFVPLEPAEAASSKPASQLVVQTPQQGEQALRDGLKILMDGRLIWHGLFTPDVPMAMERSDAWRADRDSPGGMQKGTSLRFRFDLPSLGSVELWAVSFGANVSARIQVDPTLASKVAHALPHLHARLKDRGLGGTQVAVETY
jgi:hypothetical protein